MWLTEQAAPSSASAAGPTEFLKAMNSKSLEVTHLKHKLLLREQCRKLFEELPDDTVAKYEITTHSPGGDMTKVMIGLVEKHAGEIVEFDKSRTTWRLAQVERRSKGLAELCWCQTQFPWLESGRPLGDVYAAHLAEPFLSEEADQLIWYDAAVEVVVLTAVW